MMAASSEAEQLKAQELQAATAALDAAEVSA